MHSDLRARKILTPVYRLDRITYHVPEKIVRFNKIKKYMHSLTSLITSTDIILIPLKGIRYG